VPELRGGAGMTGHVPGAGKKGEVQSDRTLLLTTLPPSVAGHVAVALRLYVDRARVWRMPEDVLRRLSEDFAAVANHGQHRTPDALEAWAAQAQTQPLLVDYTEAGRLLGGVSSRTVSRLVASGDLPAVKVGGSAMVRYADVEGYVRGLPAARQGSEKAA